MPAPHAFWVIVDGATPTAFRAKHRDALVPTLKQLQRTQPNVALRWFDRGRLWDSPLAARDALRERRLARPDRRPEWRPGGNHVDPRERFKLTRDQKRARFKKRRDWKSRSQEAGKSGSHETGKPEGPGAGKSAHGGRPFRAGKDGGSRRAMRPGPRGSSQRGPRGPKRDR
jgi:hypothetical protein